MPDAGPAPIRRVGFVGLGSMGFPMARRLAAIGYDLIVADARAERTAEFVSAHGGKPARTLRELAAQSEVVIAMLPTGQAVREVIFGGETGGDCLRAGLAHGRIVIDMGTSDPVGTRALGAELASCGVTLLDAPVAGGVVFARDGTLTIMVGGPSGAIERCRPLFEAIGREIIPCGSLGCAHAVKALNNYVNAAGLIASIEALVVGRRFGVDLDVLVQAMTAATTGRNNPLEKKVIPKILTRRFDTGMAIGLIAKDVQIAAGTAASIDAWAPMAECVAALWRKAANRLGTDRDQTEVARLWEEAVGVTLAMPRNDELQEAGRCPPPGEGT